MRGGRTVKERTIKKHVVSQPSDVLGGKGRLAEMHLHLLLETVFLWEIIAERSSSLKSLETETLIPMNFFTLDCV